MNRRVLAAARVISPKLAQRLELESKQRRTREPAYESARIIARVNGPEKLAADLGLPADLPLPTLAELAAVDYNPKARGAAKQGTLDGFEEFEARR